jgi:amino acid adenylation domain-containing protein
MFTEYKQSLEEPDATRTGHSSGICVHQRFEQQVERTPEAVALIYEQQSLSYQALNDRANQLAHYLQAAGVGPGTLVGLCIERSLAMVISILAVLKAGGGYVPLDLDYPDERLAFMLNDAQVNLLLTERVEHLSGYHTSAVCLETVWEIIDQESTANLSSAVTHRDIAYVIYTSGSTGLPKGVMIEHSGLVNMLDAQIRAFGVQPHHRIAQFASFSFDASVSELFMALLAGAQLCLIPQERRWPPPVLLQYLQEYAITTITLPPSVLAVLPTEDLPALQTIISAGEELSSAIAARWATGRQVFNAYGPTESTVCATIGQCHAQARRPSIGYPIAYTRIYLLDPLLQPVSGGTVAEVYIGSIGLARGYLNRPELTAEKFLPHPFSTEPGARLYRTGDRARSLPDGSIEYIGRTDRMVKIRGFRVELGEVEAVLEQHPLLLQSLVTVYEDSHRARRLAAYVIPQPDCNEKYALLQKEVVRFLQRKLPRYMLPAAFVVLSAFPLTLNGKIDQRALLPPDPSYHMVRYNKERQ